MARLRAFDLPKVYQNFFLDPELKFVSDVPVSQQSIMRDASLGESTVIEHTQIEESAITAPSFSPSREQHIFSRKNGSFSLTLERARLRPTSLSKLHCLMDSAQNSHPREGSARQNGLQSILPTNTTLLGTDKEPSFNHSNRCQIYPDLQEREHPKARA